MDKMMAYEIEEVESVEMQSFKVEDKQQAEWCLRKIKAFKEQISENTELANAEVKRINSWLEKENQKATDHITYFESLLQQYMINQREIDPKVKSIKLPHGSIKFKKQQPEWKFDDEKTLEWLKSNYPDKIQVVEKFNKTEIKSIVKDTGEIFEGLEIIEREDKFEVTTD